MYSESIVDVNDMMVELIDEFEIDDALDKLNNRLESLTGKDKILRIGNQQFEINIKDQIFFLTGPKKHVHRTDQCATCQDFVFENEKQRLVCQFCGN